MLQTAPIPVTLAIANQTVALQVRNHVESHYNWQVIKDGSHLEPHLIITDHVASEGPHDMRPTVLIVTQDSNTDGKQDDSRQTPSLPPHVVGRVMWPQDAHLLATLVPKQKVRKPIRSAIVSGSSAGVGATTTSLILGSIAAWANYHTALPANPQVLQYCGMTKPGDHPRLAELTVAPTSIGIPHTCEVAVIPAALSTHTNILVGRPDRAFVMALQHCTPSIALLIGDGPYYLSELRRIKRLSQTLLLQASFSMRIARGGVQGAIPEAIPKRALKPYRTIAKHLWGITL